jgi:multidrug efflux pump subunit AcrA (membrane-fusion protein)
VKDGKKDGKPAAKKRLVPIITVLVLIAGAAGIAAFFRLRRAPEQEQTYTVREEVYQNVIEISGNIQAAQEQKIQAAGDGIVEKVYIREGDRVKAGQLLFTLSDAQERYNLANHEFQMNQERVNGASAKLTLMEEQRKVLRQNIADRSLTARFDGVIGQLKLAEGDYAKAQDVFGYLIDRSYLKATVEVVETDAARLKGGQKVRLDFAAYPDLAVEGEVVSYPAVGRITSRGATVLDTEIRVDNPADEIIPGYSFTGEIIGGPPERVLTVEAAAIAYENGRAYVERVGRGGPPRDSGEGARLRQGSAGEGGRRGEGGGARSGPGPAAAGPPPGPPPSGGPPDIGGGRPPAFSDQSGGERPGAAEQALAAPERIAVEAAPYGPGMVRILSGLEAGDRLKAQSGESGFGPGARRRSGRGMRLF